MLLAYDATGAIIATLDFIAQYENGKPLGVVDFEANETGHHTDIWNVSDAVGSGFWPEELGSQAHVFRVELDGKRIVALIHRTSGHRRERPSVTRGRVLVDEAGDERDERRPVLPLR